MLLIPSIDWDKRHWDNVALNYFWWHIRVTLVAAFGFLAIIFGKWQEPRNLFLSFFVCWFNGGDTMRWWEHSNHTMFWIIYLNLLHLRWYGHKKIGMPVLAPIISTNTHTRATWWNFHFPIVHCFAFMAKWQMSHAYSFIQYIIH